MKVRTMAAVVVGGGLIAGGMLLLMGGSALAGVPGTCVASTVATDTNCTTTASVTVPEAVTISDNTPSIDFGTPVTLPATQGPQAVSLTISSNDVSGFNDMATASNADTADSAIGSGLWNGLTGSSARFIPFSGLMVQGATGFAGPSFVTYAGPTAGGTGNTPATYGINGNGIDGSPSPTSGSGVTITDNWQLMVPGGQAPGTYRAAIVYSVFAN